MTLILTEGFETHLDDETTLTPKWTVRTAGTLSLTARTGARGMSAPALSKTVAAGQEHATFVCGFSYYSTALSNIDIARFTGDAGATEHVVLRRTSAGELAIDRGATQLAITTSTPVPADSTHRYIEMKAVLDDTVGTIDVYLNGNHATPVLTFSGDTKNAGTAATFDTFVLAANTSSIIVDDIYFLTGAGSAPVNDLLGEVRCWPLAPNGNGNSSQLVGSDANSTDNYLLVDEIAGVVNAADYVGTAVDGNKDTYTYTDLTPSTGTIVAVELASYVLKSDAGAKSFRPVVRHSGTDYGGTDVVLATGRVRSAQLYEENPGTTAAWTVSDVNAAEFGAEARP